MDFSLNEEQRMWQQAVHEFVAAKVRPAAAEMDATATFNREAVEAMVPLGLLGLNVAEEYGGADVDTVEAAIALEELGWACGGTALSVAAHNGLACEAIAAFGNSEQKERWLPTLASGQHGLGALALTEPEAGSDLVGGIRTRARLEGGEWVIEGNKAWITNASLAPTIVTLCRTDPDGGSGSLSLIVVPSDAGGMTIHPPEKKMGTRASPANAISYQEVRVPEDHLLGKPGRGLYQTLQILDGGRIGIGALSIGLARAAYELAVAYAQERTAFGAPLSEHQALRFALADANTQIEAARAMVFRAAWLKDEGQPYTLAAAQAKLLATEMAERVCRDAIQIHGGYGYSTEYPLERLYRDARLMTIGEGTSEVQRLVIAHHIFDR